MPIKIFYLLGFVGIVSAAIIPFDGLRQQNSTTNAISKSDSSNLDATIFNDEGYKYKTVRRLKYRMRRDVSQLDNDYLPPVEESQEKSTEDSVNEHLPPVEEVTTEANVEVKSVDQSGKSADLGGNGYEYRTVRRLKYRQRRDVSEIENEYLPPVEEETTETTTELKSVEEPEDTAVLGDNGYEYRTVRRLKYRQRQIANEYLPPAEEETTEAAAELKSVEEPEDSALLGDNGYEYRTVRRLKYRQRRDVSEIANEYLPPAEEETTETTAELKSVDEPEDSAILGDNGYEYKSVRRLKYRQRRDLKKKSVDEPEDSAILGDNGYEYKSVRRLKYRQRRDVANEYLSPAQEEIGEAEPENSAILGSNGYHYKTVRRLKYRY
ncbi:hypothetical protein CVS40_10054 [Lucilia cuprina]|nr:hypothetical protein CVS40_10054 [Lucilia cuprina]